MASRILSYSVQRTGDEPTDRNLDLIKRALDSLSNGGTVGPVGPRGDTGAAGAAGADASLPATTATDLFLRSDGTWADPVEDINRKFRLLLKHYVDVIGEIPPGLEDETEIAMETE